MSVQNDRAHWYGTAVCIVCFLSLLLACQPGAAATPVAVQARLTESDIYLGESTTLELRIQGLRQPTPPDITHPDIEITKAGGQSFSHTSYSVSNGQVRQTEEFGYSARYVLRPYRAGSLEIPPIAVVHEGQTYHSKPLTLLVRRPAAQELLLVEVHTEKPSYVLGEAVTLTLDLSIRKLTANGAVLETDPFFREQPPHVQIPWFESLGDWKTTDLKTFVQPFVGEQRPGFYVNDYRRAGIFDNPFLTFAWPRRSTSRTTSSGTVEYFTYRLQKQFRPVRAGVQTVPPVLVKANLPTQVDGRGRALRTEKIVASSAPLSIEIRPVPTVGQPASFSGAIGHFSLTVEAQPTMLRVGDPFSLSLTLRGEGLLDTVHAPPLERQAQLTQDFKLHADPPAVKTESQAKTFTYTLRPRRAGIREVPPLEVAYFDPQTQRFQVLRSDPVPLRVEAANTLDLSEVVQAGEESAKNVLGQELTDGILANYSGAEVLVPQHFQLHIGLWTGVLLLLPPMTYGAALTWRWQVRRRRRHPEVQRAKKAARRALAALRALPAQHGETGLCDGVHQALTGYIGDKLHLVGAGLTADDVTRHLQARHLDPSLIERVATLLHLCDSARYAPGSLAVAQLTGLVEEAEALVRQLEVSGRL